MTPFEVQQKILKIAQRYWEDTPVIFANHNAEKPATPYVTIQFRDLTRSAMHYGAGDERYYDATWPMDVNLYTDGKPVNISGGVAGSYANTAVSDMTLFADYLESEDAMIDEGLSGISVQMVPPVRDLSELENDRNYRFRAMVECSVNFAVEANGPLGTRDTENHSGGGVSDASAHAERHIETAETEEEKT